MHALFDIYKVDVGGSAEWLGSVQSYSVALLEIQLAAVEAPADYVIVKRQTGDRIVLSYGLRGGPPVAGTITSPPLPDVNRNRIQRRTRKVARTSVQDA